MIFLINVILANKVSSYHHFFMYCYLLTRSDGRKFFPLTNKRAVHLLGNLEYFSPLCQILNALFLVSNENNPDKHEKTCLYPIDPQSIPYSETRNFNVFSFLS